MKKLAVALCAALLLAGCAWSTHETTQMPTRRVAVVISDVVPLDLYFNYDDAQCSAVDEGPEITISNGAGVVVAAKDAPLIGGKMTLEKRCDVTVTFDAVPAADIYTVTVKSASGRVWSTTVQSESGDQEIRIRI